jgi:hypothetical protein
MSNVSGGGRPNPRSNITIPQVDTDPVSPTAEQAWVKKTAVAVPISHTIFTLGLTIPGGSTPPAYEFKYRTKEGTTVSVALT